MEINDLKEHVKRTISMKLEIKELKSNDIYKLSDYLERFHQSLIRTDFGNRDKFWLPYYYASNEVTKLFEIKTKEFDAKFSANKTKLLSILNRHIKGLQLGFREHDSELKSAPRY